MSANAGCLGTGRRRFGGWVGLCVAGWVWQSIAAETGPTVQIRTGNPPEISWSAPTGCVFRVEFTLQLGSALWQGLSNNLAGTGTWMRVLDSTATNAQRFYRIVQTSSTNAVPSGIATNAVLPVPGILYPENTVLGSQFFGVQFAIPPAWKGGLKAGSSVFVFGSDTEPGLVLGMFTVAGQPADYTHAFNGGFNTSATGGFDVSQPPVLSGDQITAEWIGHGDTSGVTMRLAARMHPSGGLLGFAGLFIEANRAAMESTLTKLLASTGVAARPTNTELVNDLGGRAFQWVKASDVNGGAFSSSSLSSWSQSYAYFCPDGTYEVDTFSETSFSGTLKTATTGDYLGYYAGGSSGSSKDSGQWTVIASAYGPIMVMQSSTGFQIDLLNFSADGNTVVFGDQEFQFYRFHTCQ